MNSYLVLFFVAVIAVSLLRWIFKTQTNMVYQEPFDNSVDRTKIADTITANTNTIDDNLIISKYRKDYENMIVDLDSCMDSAILSEVLNNAETISEDPSKAIESIQKINAMKEFKDTLDLSMQVLDKK